MLAFGSREEAHPGVAVRKSAGFEIGVRVRAPCRKSDISLLVRENAGRSARGLAYGRSCAVPYESLNR